MDVVSVKMRRGDAALLLGVVEGELDGCDCGAESVSVRCDRCEALAAIRGDLGRLLTARRPTRAHGSLLAFASSRAAAIADRAARGPAWPHVLPLSC